jgi:hypothetical protein
MGLPLFVPKIRALMAEYYDDDYSIEDGSNADLNSILFGNDFETDEHAQVLFSKAFFDGDEGAYQDLVDWLWDEYEIDFEQAFDWEDFRAWYDAA